MAAPPRTRHEGDGRRGLQSQDPPQAEPQTLSQKGGQLQDDTELFKQFSDNESFRRWLTDTIFSITYEAA